MAAVGGFEVIDTQEDARMLSITDANICYYGYMDAVIVLMAAAAIMKLCGWEWN